MEANANKKKFTKTFEAARNLLSEHRENFMLYSDKEKSNFKHRVDRLFKKATSGKDNNAIMAIDIIITRTGYFLNEM